VLVVTGDGAKGYPPGATLTSHITTVGRQRWPAVQYFIGWELPIKP
jgi:hypothetical protein